MSMSIHGGVALRVAGILGKPVERSRVKDIAPDAVSILLALLDMGLKVTEVGPFDWGRFRSEGERYMRLHRTTATPDQLREATERYQRYDAQLRDRPNYSRVHQTTGLDAAMQDMLTKCYVIVAFTTDGEFSGGPRVLWDALDGTRVLYPWQGRHADCGFLQGWPLHLIPEIDPSAGFYAVTR